MDAERSDPKPAASDIPAPARKMRGINADMPQVKTVSLMRRGRAWERGGGSAAGANREYRAFPN